MLDEPTVIAIPFFVLSMAIEAYVLRRSGGGYDLRDSATSLSGGFGMLGMQLLTKSAWFALYIFLYEHRLFTLPMGAAYVVALVFAEDLCYYAYHRTSHEVRIFWAGHVAHHSSEHYNLSTALRQSWTEPFFAVLFWTPLPLLGFRPEHIALMSSFSLLYQYWIHTETIGTLGPLEHVMNTPSHHRVHHGSNPQYIDKNHAGIFIIWDRLFGTFEPEGEKVVYGLTKPLGSFNPFVVQTHELRDILRDVRAARSLREAWHAVFRNPGDVPKTEASPVAEPVESVRHA